MAAKQITAWGIDAELHALKRDSSANGSNGRRVYDDPDVPYGALTAYAVHVNGERVGVVSSKKGTSHRKAGRLITHTSHPTEWVGTITGFYAETGGEWRPVKDTPKGTYLTARDRCTGDWHQARQDAAERLLRVWEEVSS